ncbi:MAG: DMT family transporter [Rikenellaceae bacterium]|nr:DMT family transporter [Rikenellaceae bacterium]
MKHSSSVNISLSAIVACIIWGSAFPGAKIGFEYTGPIFLSGLRFTLAGLLLVPVMLFMKVDVRPIFKQWRFMLLFAFLQTFLQYGLFFMGLDKVPASTSAIIIGAGPLFVAIMAHLTLKDDKLSIRKIAAITLGICGVIFISLTKGGLADGTASASFYTGVCLLIGSNLTGSYTNIMVVKRKDSGLSPVALTSFANFTGGLLLLLVSFVFEKPELKIYPAEFYGALIWLALIPATAFSIWYTQLQKPGVKVSELNMWKFMVPVSACILSWILLADDRPTWQSVTGIIIITSALFLSLSPGKK